MKKLLLTGFVTTVIVVSANAQIKNYDKKVNAIKSQGSLAWYKTFLNNKGSLVKAGSAETILGERSLGALKVQVGANLVPANSSYVNNGNAKTEESGNITCNVQPKKINYLVPGDFSIMRQSFSFTNYPGDFVNPANIINASSALSPYQTPNPRNPYKIGISIFAPNGTNEITVTDFNTIPQAKIQDSLLARNFGASIPANGILEISEIKSSVQLSASLEYSYGVFLPLEELGIPADITAGLRLENNDSLSTNLRFFMVSFTQPLYSLNLLTNINGLFVNPQHLANNSNGAFISDVTYGRRALFIFAATSFEALRDAMFEGGLNATVTGGEAAGVEVGVKAEGNINAQIKSSIKKFWGILYGGNSTQTLTSYNDINAFHQEFKKYITSSSARTFSRTTGALPISYSLRRISDGAVIGVRSIGSFDEKVECNTNRFSVDVNFSGFTVNKVVEAPLDNEDDIWGTFGYAKRNTNSTTITQGKVTLFSKTSDKAISKGENRSYDAGDNPVRIIDQIGKTDLINTILNFTEDVKDWELLMSPTYDPSSGSAMQFDFSTKASEINTLAPGQTKTFEKSIPLFENGKSDAAKVTFKVEIKVRRN